MSSKKAKEHAKQRAMCYENLVFGYIKKITKSFDHADMTDNTNTTGYIDFATDELPANVIVLGWKCVTTEGFSGDTTATIQVGVSGTLDLYSAVTSGSVLAAGIIGSVVKTTGVVFNEAAATPRITITGGADFTSISAGKATVDIYYIDLKSDVED